MSRSATNVRRHRVVPVILTIAIAAIAACTSPAAPSATSAPAGGTAESAKPAVNPATVTVMVASLGSERFDRTVSAGGNTENNYSKLIHGYLVEVDRNGQLAPGIASKWTLSPDALTWTFTIRSGLKFHDGSPLTVDDVLWSLKHYFGPGAEKYSKEAAARTLAPTIAKMELSGTDAVAVGFKTPVPDFPALLSTVSQSWFAVLPKRAEQQSDAAELAYDKRPIGAGPLKLVEHATGQVMRLERFDDYYHQPKNGFADDQRVPFQKLELQIVPEESTRVAAIKAGKADIAPVSLSAADQVRSAGGRMVFASAGVTIEPRLYGCWKPEFPCSKKGVRQALDLAIDKKQIQALYGGPDVFEIKGWYRVTPFTIGYSPTLDPRPFDAARARQLLADAGYPGGKGFGKLILNSFPSAAIPFQVETAQLVADLWRRELGLDVEVKVGDPSALRDKERAGQLFGQVTWQDNNPVYDASASILAKYAQPTSLEIFANDPELTKLSRDTFALADPTKRVEATKSLYVRLRDESYNLGVGYVNIPWATGPRVTSWKPLPLAPHPSALDTLALK